MIVTLRQYAKCDKHKILKLNRRSAIAHPKMHARHDGCYFIAHSVLNAADLFGEATERTGFEAATLTEQHQTHRF